LADDPNLEKYNMPEARAEYARRCRALSAELRKEGDLSSADLNAYLADLYDGLDVSWYLQRFTDKDE
jgi:hypothetical protein